jgi:hypothetical protein
MRTQQFGRILQQVGGALSGTNRSRRGGHRSDTAGFGRSTGTRSGGYGRSRGRRSSAPGGSLGRMVSRFFR